MYRPITLAALLGCTFNVAAQAKMSLMQCQFQCTVKSCMDLAKGRDCVASCPSILVKNCKQSYGAAVKVEEARKAEEQRKQEEARRKAAEDERKKQEEAQRKAEADARAKNSFVSGIKGPYSESGCKCELGSFGNHYAKVVTEYRCKCPDKTGKMVYNYLPLLPSTPQECQYLSNCDGKVICGKCEPKDIERTKQILGALTAEGHGLLQKWDQTHPRYWGGK